MSRLRAALERLNPALPPEAITAAVDELTRDRSAMSLEAANREVYLLLKASSKSRRCSCSTRCSSPRMARTAASARSRRIGRCLRTATIFEVRAGLAFNASSARTSRAGCRWR